jgi:hypothetical protein
MDTTANTTYVPAGLTRTAAFLFGAMFLAGIAAFVAGVSAEPQRLWAELLVVSYYLVGVGLGGAVLLALFAVTGARWCETILPATIRSIALLPAGAIGVAVVLLAYPALYPWTKLDDSEMNSNFQALWLERPFFLGRAFVYLVLWLILAYFLVRSGRRVRIENNSRPATSTGLAAVFLVVFGLTCWLAGTDWIMSLEPKWSSTIFGVYQFTGMFLSALAAVIVLCAWLNRRGVLRGKLTPDHLRDLGTLLFAFSSFWMYIWFSQYLLIWYVNNPEETEYFVVRQYESWHPLFLANLILNWVTPFVVLLFRPAKESTGILVAVALVVLVGRLVDLYLMVLPPIASAGPVFGLWDAGLVLGATALAALLVLGGRHKLQPVA